MNRLNLYIFLAIMGFSFLSWIYNQLRLQRERLRIQQERERRRLEALRTGRGLRETAAARPSHTVLSPAAQHAQQIAQRRQAQLERLRRQQALRAAMSRSSGTPSPGTPRIPSAPGTGLAGRGVASAGPHPVLRTTPPGPGAARTPSAGPRPARPQRASSTPPRLPPEQIRALRRRRASSRASRTPPPEAEPIRRIVPDVRSDDRSEEPSPSSRRSALGEMDRQDWRRAVLIREILDPPLAIREEDHLGGVL